MATPIYPMRIRMLRVSWTEKRTNESILMEIGHARGDYVAETEDSNIEDILWLRDASKRFGKGDDAGMRREKKKERPPH